MGQLTQNFVDLAMATCKEGRHPSLTVWEAQQLLHAWNDREALRARVAELEADAARYQFIKANVRRLDINGLCLSIQNLEVRIDQMRDVPSAGGGRAEG